ncbi:serine/threonine-protein kinase [Embleya sp. NPDC059213]|uniref:serine/threonine-protein kinase n=2 Tax=Embleya TaxID=2699295 RepID=UPI00369395C3
MRMRENAGGRRYPGQLGCRRPCVWVRRPAARGGEVVGPRGRSARTGSSRGVGGWGRVGGHNRGRARFGRRPRGAGIGIGRTGDCACWIRCCRVILGRLPGIGCGVGSARAGWAASTCRTRGGQPVALKVVRPDLARDPEFRRRFEREVQAARRVYGPYTAPVLDSNTDGPLPWPAGAYVAGPPLSEAVRVHGPLPVETVLLLVAGVAEALEAVHAAGVIHRDLKPSNVLPASDGPRVIDFGIARAADTTALTGTDVAVGTPAFMSPEQVQGRPVGFPSDVFSLALVGHYAATGDHPFGQGHAQALMYRIVGEAPDLSTCPEPLRGVLDACLAKDPADRPSLAEVIEGCRRGAEVTTLVRGQRGVAAGHAQVHGVSLGFGR